MLPEACEGVGVRVGCMLCAAGLLGTFVFEKVLVAPEGGDGHGHHHGGVAVAGGGMKGAFVSLVVTAVLSVHSFIAGFALGLQRSTAHGVPILVTIVAHKVSRVMLVQRPTPTSGWRRCPWASPSSRKVTEGVACIALFRGSH